MMGSLWTMKDAEAETGIPATRQPPPTGRDLCAPAPTQRQDLLSPPMPQSLRPRATRPPPPPCTPPAPTFPDRPGWPSPSVIYKNVRSSALFLLR